MSIFMILLHFGLKIMSLSAATTDTTSTHICADYDCNTNKTTVKWAVSSQIPVVVQDCDLIYREVGTSEPAQLINNLPSHGTNVLERLRGLSTWTIQVTCTIHGGVSFHSPEIRFIPGNASSTHVCSDSGLASLVPSDAAIPIVLCIWRPESALNYTVVRWQPTPLTASSPVTLCALHREVKGQLYSDTGLHVDDMQHYKLESSYLSAWVTCNTGGESIYSGKATYTNGTSTVCSVDAPHLWSVAPTWSTDAKPTESSTLDNIPHSTLGISNMAMGLALAASIALAAVILSVGFVRWFRWQRRRRRERLLRNGEPANDQSAMEDFQQML